MAEADECYPVKTGAMKDVAAPTKNMMEPMKDFQEDSTAEISDSESRDDEDDLNELTLYFSGFHAYYMRKDLNEYLVPVIFEDGMDFQECEQYYASLKSQESIGRPSLRTRLQRKSSLRELQQIIANDSPSCLRRQPRYKSKIDLEKAKVRRCSFNGTAPVAVERPCLQRSNSQRDVKESKPGVSFDEYVQVWTVFKAYEYPEDIRRAMWMSRDEMKHCMQRAVAEKVAERRRQLIRKQELEQKEEETTMAEEAKRHAEEELILAEEERVRAEERALAEERAYLAEEEKKDQVQRQNSDNCVVAECQHTVMQITEITDHITERLEIWLHKSWGEWGHS